MTEKLELCHHPPTYLLSLHNDGDDPESPKSTAKRRWRPNKRACLLLGSLALHLILGWHTIMFYIMYNQRRFLYHSYFPHLSRNHVMKPEQVGFEAPYRQVWVDCEDGVRLHAFLFTRREQGKHKTMYWFQGTTGNIGHKLSQARHIYEHCECNIFLISYRGYGLSNGEPSYRGIQLDTQTGLDYLRQQPEVDANRIVLYGQSLGGAIALDLLARNRDTLAGCIIENTFTDIASMHRLVFPLFRGLAHMLSEPWDNLASLRTVGTHMPPMLFLSGRRDELIPPEMMDALWAKAREVAEPGQRIVKRDFAEGRHTCMFLLPGFYDAIAEYFRAV